jgi:hypothetical protein
MTRSDFGAVGEAELVELDRSECLSLLAEADVGRIIFTEAAMPAAHPVTYVLDGEEILFRTGGGQALAAIDGAVVGFQSDSIDHISRTGWSVLGIGHAYEVCDPRRLGDLGQRLPVSWAPQRSPHVVAVPLQRLTGRRLARIA